MGSSLTQLASVQVTVFMRLWGIAAVAHVVGNWRQPDLPLPVGWANLLVGMSGLCLVAWPGRRLLLSTAALTLVSLLLEMPVTGNHWLVAGLVSLAILVSKGDPTAWMPAARFILLVFYGFAAFAKLNSGFFDPGVSCAVFYGNQWLDGIGLGQLGPASIAARLIIWGSAIIELSVPVLLAWRRSRMWGVLVASTFHTFISFDLNQHFFDFTAVLLPLFFLFVPQPAVDRIGSELARMAGRVSHRSALLLGVVTGAMVALAAVPLGPGRRSWLDAVPFFIWIPISIVWLLLLVRFRSPGQSLAWTLRPATVVVVMLALLNGLTPYFEVKTAQSFNMYSNLLTADGSSNHLLVRGTIPLRDGYTDPVAIVDSPDPNLVAYRELRYLIAYPEFRRYLSTRPETAVTYSRGGQETEIVRSADDPQFSAPVPWWWRFVPLRSLDQQEPPRCQSYFLGAL